MNRGVLFLTMLAALSLALLICCVLRGQFEGARWCIGVYGLCTLGAVALWRNKR